MIAEDKKKLKKKFADKKKNRAIIYSVLIYVALYILCSVGALYFSGNDSAGYEAGMISNETITATRDIEDTYSTELLRQEEMQKVQPVYKIDGVILDECNNKINDTFNKIDTVRASAKKMYVDNRYTSYSTPTNVDFISVDWSTALSEAQVNELLKQLPEYMTAQSLYTIAAIRDDRVTMLRDAYLEQISSYWTSGVLEDDKEKTLRNITSAMIGSGICNNAQGELLYLIGSNSMQANKTFDNDATEAEKEKVAASIEPVTFRKGQNIVQKGEVITESQYRIIKELGLTEDSNSLLARGVAVFGIMGVVFGIWIIYGFVSDRSLIESIKNSTAVSILIGLTVVFCAFGAKIDDRILIAFLPAIMGMSLLRRRTTIIMGVLTSVIVALVVPSADTFIFNPYTARLLLSGILGSTVSVLVINRMYHRGEFILAGLVAGVACTVVYGAYSLLTGSAMYNILANMLYGLLSGLGCGFLSVGLLPVWEAVFSIATPTKLLEMSNPGNPLLKKLMTEAPGTYHHSLMTANLAEGAIEVIGGDALLARVAAYYHDVGKLKNPVMFKENQLHVSNPHDNMTPAESAAVIIDHVQYGRRLAEHYKLPKSVIDIVAQHHGTSLASFFYSLAKKEDDTVKEEDFRYPGPKPQTREAGVVMLADTVEAAIRANAGIKKETMSEQINMLINAKVDDGQLDDCPLTKRDIKMIALTFGYVLEGANHERIVYPEEERDI